MQENIEILTDALRDEGMTVRSCAEWKLGSSHCTKWVAVKDGVAVLFITESYENGGYDIYLISHTLSVSADVGTILKATQKQGGTRD